MLLDGERSSKRTDLLAGVVRHQLARAGQRFAHNRQAGLESLNGALFLVRVGEMRTTSFDTHYEIRKTNGNELAATGKVVVVLYDWARDSKMPIGDELRRKVEECSHRDVS